MHVGTLEKFRKKHPKLTAYFLESDLIWVDYRKENSDSSLAFTQTYIFSNEISSKSFGNRIYFSKKELLDGYYKSVIMMALILW